MLLYSALPQHPSKGASLRCRRSGPARLHRPPHFGSEAFRYFAFVIHFSFNYIQERGDLLVREEMFREELQAVRG